MEFYSNDGYLYLLIGPMYSGKTTFITNYINRI